MPAEQYFVIMENGEWKISFKDVHYGPYATRQAAIDDAVEAAAAMSNIGIDVQVMVKDTDQDSVKPWTNGESFTR